jgi:adenylate cyclase
MQARLPPHEQALRLLPRTPVDGRGVGRRLAAILSADIKGYSRLIGRDEVRTHRRVGAALAAMGRDVEKCGGRIFSFSGDGVMAEFASAVEALRCALAVQRRTHARNARLAEEQRIAFRMGVSLGDIVDEGGRAGGDTVNVAARLEQIADPGSIAITYSVFEQISRTIDASYTFRGEYRLKNIDQPALVYMVDAKSPARRRATAPSVPPAPPVASDPRPSLAVLPFRTLEDGADAYFAEGFVEDVVRMLCGLNDLLVIARSSTISLGRQMSSPGAIAKRLNVRYLLRGSVRRSGGHIRIATELSDAETMQLVWADRFDAELDQLFDVQDQIATRVAHAIAPQIRGIEIARANRKHPASMTAYDIFLQALGLFYRMDRESFARSHALLEVALKLDPGYALAYSYLAYWHVNRVGQGWSEDPERDTVEAAALARTAIELDHADALGLAIFAHTQAFLLKDFATAAEHFDRALQVGPSCALAWTLSALTREFMGDAPSALARAEHGLRLAPLGPDVALTEIVLAQAHYLLGRFDEAVEWAERATQRNLWHTGGLRTLIVSLVASGRLEAARRAAARHLELTPGFTLRHFAARTPFRVEIRDLFVARLQAAGMPP